MFCPDCGTDNSKNQRFCTRCGTNLTAIDRARDIIDEFTSGSSRSDISASTILKVVAIISSIGFVFTTVGVILLTLIIRNDNPVPFFFGVGGFLTIIFVCRYLLNLLKAGEQNADKKVSAQRNYNLKATLRGNTNRALEEPSESYHSVVEESTRQFEKERR